MLNVLELTGVSLPLGNVLLLSRKNSVGISSMSPANYSKRPCFNIANDLVSRHGYQRLCANSSVHMMDASDHEG